MIKFLKEDNQLIIISNTGTVVWKGNPYNWSVSKVVEVQDSETAIILLDYYKWDKSRGFNLICIDLQGNILWQATEKNGQLEGESITDIQAKEGHYFANTWNGNRLSVDEKTGRLSFLNFTK